VTPSRHRNGLGSQVIHQIIMVTSVKVNCLAKMAVHKKGSVVLTFFQRQPLEHGLLMVCICGR